MRGPEHEDREIVAAMEDATHGFQGCLRGEAGGEKDRDSYADARQRENRMFDVTYQYGILVGVMWGLTDVKRHPQRRPPSSPAESAARISTSAMAWGRKCKNSGISLP